MKISFQWICLLAGLLRVMAAGPEVADDSSPPLYRYLVVVDTSAPMAAPKEVTADAVNKLVLGGFNGRIQTGDTLGIWTFAEKLNKNTYGPAMWVTDQRMDLANRAFRVLRDAKFAKTANMGRVIAEIREAAKASGSLDVFLFTDGTVPVQGTPFDAAINQVFQEHGATMRKSKKPFVVVFSAQHGELVAHAISPAGNRVFIPPLAKPAPGLVTDDDVFGIKRATETNSVEQSSVSNSAKQGGATTNAPKSLSVAEISELLKQQQEARSNALAAAAAAAAAAGKSNVAEAQAPSAAQSVVASNASPRAPVAVGSQRVPIDAAPSPAVSRSTNPTAPPETGESPSAARSQIAEQTEKGTGPSPAAPQSATNVDVEPGDQPASAPSSERTADSGVVQETVAVVSPMGRENSQKYLIVAAVFFGCAMVLGWVLVRSRRSRVYPSLITRSLRERE